MARVRWQPARELHTLQGEMNRLFNAFFDTPASGRGTELAGWMPAMDIVETDDAFILEADLPGMSEEDVNIDVEDNVLTISGERRSDAEEKRAGYYRCERAYGVFRRSLTLPEGVDPQQVTADVDKGVLKLRIPKPEERKPKRVQIKVGPAAREAKTGERSSSR